MTLKPFCHISITAQQALAHGTAVATTITPQMGGDNAVMLYSFSGIAQWLKDNGLTFLVQRASDGTPLLSDIRICQSKD